MTLKLFVIFKQKRSDLDQSTTRHFLMKVLHTFENWNTFWACLIKREYGILDIYGICKFWILDAKGISNEFLLFLSAVEPRLKRLQFTKETQFTEWSLLKWLEFRDRLDWRSKIVRIWMSRRSKLDCIWSRKVVPMFNYKINLSM